MNVYRYTGCGLPNVYLKNGFNRQKTSYGNGVSIEDLAGLHKAIGIHIAKCSGKLSGLEFRFLRNELGLSQKKLGILFGCSDQTIANYEKGKEIPALADRTIRVMYLDRVKGRNQNMIKLMDFLNELDDQEYNITLQEEEGGGWTVLHEEAA